MAYAEKRGDLWRARWREEDGTLRSESGFRSPGEAVSYGQDREEGSSGHVCHPARGDQVEAWIMRTRDQYPAGGALAAAWRALNGLLDDYRLHADTGTPLTGHAREGGHCGR